MKTHLLLIVMLGWSCLAYGDGTNNPPFTVYFNASDLTVVNVKSNKLDCTWYTIRKDLLLHQQSVESYDKHVSSISLTGAEVSKLFRWATNAIETKVTDEQNVMRGGYSTVLAVRLAGKTYNPNHDTLMAFSRMVFAIIEDRRRQGF